MPTDRDRYKPAGSGPRNSRSGSYRASTPGPRNRSYDYQNESYKGPSIRDSKNAYLQRLQDLIYGSGGYGAMDQGGGYGSGGGGGGGGGGGASAYEQWQIAQEEKRQAELQRRKAELMTQLQGARGQALPLLQQYGQQYNKDIAGVFGQNQALNAGYANQLKTIQGQMNQGTQGTQQMLQRDLMGQGVQGGGPEMQALQGAAQQGIGGTNFLSQLGQQYNTRLAQAMAAAQADAGSMGAAIKSSSMGNLENAYANMLAQIGMIGLQ